MNQREPRNPMTNLACGPMGSTESPHVVHLPRAGPGTADSPWVEIFVGPDMISVVYAEPAGVIPTAAQRAAERVRPGSPQDDAKSWETSRRERRVGLGAWASWRALLLGLVLGAVVLLWLLGGGA